MTYSRQDFWATTSNKQLNFLQHVRTMLKTNGRAAIVVSDNVLFEGGAGETVRRNLMQSRDIHTLQRLPTGVFYAQGSRPMSSFLEDFVRCYNPENRRERTETERFHAFSYDELIKREKASLDIFWLKDEAWRTQTTCRSRRCWRRRLLRAWRAPWSSSRPFLRRWERRRRVNKSNLIKLFLAI